MAEHGEPRALRDRVTALLARRPLTRAELARELAAEGHPAPAVESALADAAERGWIDDLALAVDFIVTRSARLGHGPRRLIADLEARGLAQDLAERAWRLALERGEVDPERLLCAAAERRLGAARGRPTPRELRRVYTALLRAGFAEEAVRQVLRAHGLDDAAGVASLDDAGDLDGAD